MDKEKVAKGLAIGLGVGLAAPAVVMGGIAIAGFGAGGVVAGSAAAAIQSSIGSVAAGSLFATCQSIGAAGLATSTTAGLAAGGTAVGGIVGGLWPWGHKKNDPSSQNQEANAKEETTKKEVSTTKDVQEESLTESKNKEQIEETMEKDENVIEVVADGQDEAEPLPSKSPKSGKLTSAKASKLDPKYTLVSLDNAVINISPSINLPKLM